MKIERSFDASRPGSAWPSWVACLFLGLIVWGVFGQTLHHDFVNYDDDAYIYDNAVIQRGLTLDNVGWAFTNIHLHNWHPLTTLSNMLDCSLYGLNAGGHHLTNVLLHAAVAMLLFGMLREITGAFWRSAMVAAVFAVHPLRVESVAWVAERKDLLSGLFFMLSLWAYARYARNKGASGGSFGFFRAGAWWLSLLFFILGLMSKPMVVTLPIVLLLLDYWPLGRLANDGSRLGVKRLLWEKVPFLIFSVASSVITIIAQGNAVQSVDSIRVLPRICNAVVSYAVYLWQMLCPVRLTAFYPHPGDLLPMWQLGLSAMALLAVSIVVLLLWKRRPYAIIGWVWYLVMLLPVIGLLQVGAMAHADRYTYLPQIGIYVLVIWAAADLCGQWRHGPIMLGCASVLMLATLMAVARVQTAYWKNSESLWMRTLDCTRDQLTGNWVADFNFALYLLKAGRLDESVAHFQSGLERQPYDAKAHYNLGYALDKQGRQAEAFAHFQKAIRLFQNAIDIPPEYPAAHQNLGLILIKQGRHDEALANFKKAVELQPEFAEAHSQLGLALGKKGLLDEAAVHFQKVQQLLPEDAQAHNNLGNVLAGQGKLDEAIAAWLKTVQINPDHAEAQCNLGLALAEKGKFDEAIPHFQMAVKLATAQNKTAMAEAMRSKLKELQNAAPK